MSATNNQHAYNAASVYESKERAESVADHSCARAVAVPVELPE